MFGYIFTNILAAFGILYGWANPFVGLMVYYAFASLRPVSLWFWAWDKYNPPRYSFLVGASTLVGWMIAGMGKWSGIGKVSLPLLGLGLYLFSGTLAAAFSERPTDQMWDALINQYKIGLMAVVTLTLVREPRQIKIMAWCVMASFAYLAYVFNSYFVISHWNFIWIRGFGGIDNNGTAMLMVATVPLAFFLGLNSRTLWAKGFCFLSVILMVHVILFSFSRGGQLGLCIVGAMIFFVALINLPNKALTVLIALLFVVVAIRLAGPEVRERFFTIFANAQERDVSAASRFDTWSGALRCMRDHPLGVGPRTFGKYATQYGLGENKSVHNLFFQTGADYGILGMVGLAIFYFSSALQTFRMAFRQSSQRLGWPRYFGHMVCISLTGFLVCSQFIGMESVEVAFMVSLLGLCTVIYVHRIETEKDPEEKTQTDKQVAIDPEEISQAQPEAT